MIKILVVEDNEEKKNQIFGVIKSSGLLEENIDFSSNVRDAIIHLKSYVYDILVLDLKLPMRESTSQGEIVNIY